MRPRNEIARDQLLRVLGRSAPAKASELAAQLQVSIPTLHRLLHEVDPRIVSAGKARRARYALRRAVRGNLGLVPLYEIDISGRPARIGSLNLLYPEGSHLNVGDAGWPVSDELRDGWWPGLPYALYDMRPQGYLGRQLAQAEHRALTVSPDPNSWGDDDVVHVLAQVGADASGNLVLGEPAFERWQAAQVTPPSPHPSRATAAAYARLAEVALAGGVAGSSAAGEFPKFAALRERAGSATPHVLVKFSGADGSAAVRRWSDLLVAEHLALECVREVDGLRSATSRIVVQAGRTFLEVERFDRHGLSGRSRLVSLLTVDAALLGDGRSDWTLVAGRFVEAGWLDSADAARIERLWWFGRLIANTDMHGGNLSFVPHEGRLEPAPAYDMLPMAYAPLAGGEVPPRRFEPPLPPLSQRGAWSEASGAAVAFWDRTAADSRIGEAFRAICAVNARRLREVQDRLP